MIASEKHYDIQSHGSSSHNPDLSWDQTRETITMLALAIVQIESSMTDGEQSVNTLTHSFTEMAQYVAKIRDVSHEISSGKLDRHKRTITHNTQELEDSIREAVVAFQFYDRISQRLDHVCNSLDRLGGLLSDKDAQDAPEKWQALQNSIETSYTMEAERIMFEHILQGQSIPTAKAT